MVQGHQSVFKLKRVVGYLEKIISKCSVSVSKEKVSQAKKRFEEDQHLALTSRYLRPKPVAPISMLIRDRVGPQGQPAGTIATDPQEVDAILTRFNTRITDGNIPGDKRSHASSFMSKYKEHIFSSVPFSKPSWTGEFLHIICVEGPFTAGGMDGWSPIDLSILPPSAFDWIAQMLSLIHI